MLLWAKFVKGMGTSYFSLDLRKIIPVLKDLPYQSKDIDRIHRTMLPLVTDFLGPRENYHLYNFINYFSGERDLIGFKTRTDNGKRSWPSDRFYFELRPFHFQSKYEILADLCLIDSLQFLLFLILDHFSMCKRSFS